MTTAERQPLTISISEGAAEHVRDFAAQAGSVDASLRVGVKGGGCSGLTYVLDIVEEPNEGDKVIEGHGLKLFIDRKSVRLPGGYRTGVLRRAERQGLRFQQPERQDDLRVRHVLQRLGRPQLESFSDAAPL